jgi:Ubiquitin carboxyl-terminal hydrolase
MSFDSSLTLAMRTAWYTNNTPKNDAQVAAHFSSKRPILGMCLKRYSFTESGKAIRLSTRIDIPTEIGLPHFISDDSMDEDGPIYGNFKLSLQSMVCHRGTSVDSGHYISLVKGTNTSSEVENSLSPDHVQDTSHWMRFDDLATERITLVDINQALKDETPYLLFYQIVPIDNDPAQARDGESLPLYAPSEAHDPSIGGISAGSVKLRGSSDEMPPQPRPSVEVTAPEDNSRGRSPLREQRRGSVTFSGHSNHGDLAVPEPESSQSSSTRGSTHRKSGSQSRSHSQTGERFSKSLSRMTRRKSKETVTVLGNAVEGEVMTGAGLEAPAAEDEKGKGFLRREGKREKSKSRLSKFSNVPGKGKGDKPDRECSVM